MKKTESAVLARAAQIFDEQALDRRRRACHIFGWLLVVQWFAAVIAVLAVAPYTWIGERKEIHSHVWIAAIFGGVLTLAPFYLILRAPGRRLTGHVIAIAQMLYSALLIHMTGGRIETHFHIFGSLAFLAIFRDWSLLVTASAVVALDHFIRGVFVPLSVFGVAQPSPFRWVEHAAWVVFEDIVLVTFCIMSTRELRATAYDRAKIEFSHDLVEAEVKERTLELTQSAEALRESERKTRAAMDSAEAASKAKSQFLANMSHEIRTPMTAIVGYADLMGTVNTPQERTELLDVIKRNGDHLLLIINDILDLSKIEAGQMNVENVNTDIRDVVEQVAGLLRVRAEAKSISLEIECDRSMPLVLSDPLRLRQILMNLVGNAIKFTQEGKVEIIVRAKPSQTDSLTQVEFVIRDTGIGMTLQAISNLFRAFAQADNSMSRKFGGTGLGLFISQRLACMLGGGIEVFSEVGSGSTFTLTIAARIAAPATRTPSSASASQQRLTGSILLAEDGPDNQRLIATHLRRAGATVTIVGDGGAAIEAALASRASTPFDIILMDMQMPCTDGYTAAGELRKQGWTGPIVAITAHAMSGDRERCTNAGCDDYLTKPVDRHKLVQTCAQWLAPASGHIAPPQEPTQTGLAA